MLISPSARRTLLLGLPLALGAASFLLAQTPNSLLIQRLAGGKVALQGAAGVGEKWQFQVSDTLGSWEPLSTVKAAANVAYTDGGAVRKPRRFYRAVPITDAAAPVGDHIPTTAGLVTVVPVTHGSFYLHWASAAGTKIIYADPAPSSVFAASAYSSLPKADLILLTHRHGDHWSSSVVENIKNGAVTKLIAPLDVFNQMTAAQKAQTSIFKTGQTVVADNSLTLSILGIAVDGVPAYNANHVKGNCNSYLLTIGGKRIFISGDTGRTVEMEALTNVDVAFLCMNIPFTLTTADAATAVRIFRPKIVYPYHFRNQDGSLANLAAFETALGSDRDVEVRIRTWY